MKYWLMKSEPDEFSIDNLKDKKKELWTGVRNYQARNFMIQDMAVGDAVFFYHSSCEIPGIVGIAKVVSAAQTDPTQFDKKSDYFDEKSKKDNPTWKCVEVAFVEKFKNPYTLEDIKKDKKLAHMLVVKKGMRLSIQPVDKKDFEHILNQVGARL